jgi:hypothetical protein
VDLFRMLVIAQMRVPRALLVRRSDRVASAPSTGLPVEAG